VNISGDIATKTVIWSAASGEKRPRENGNGVSKRIEQRGKVAPAELFVMPFGAGLSISPTNVRNVVK